ncbi:LysM peptidoglycan-binding domain-containing protein [Nostoc sp. LEGE 12447]|uniref:LysM peptidoglycan-binding domain-containing protein n=1 Tax=Nostoc sp. LEGE 12447 TaxID=1828640 RepID=UPI0018845124|nr:LysM peptidoglycan-binding domain-containing protein [Nostoc sp. LEGE 12447]MBE9002084.1 LysM peptidoglycan-binding domain-containing protein [Nostoc sp. LEGE 12447]
MTCKIGSSYKIKAGDTLFLIAERELGDGDRWREILNPNGIPFTEKEAENLQTGQEICIPNGSLPPTGEWQSKRVFFGSNGKLTYTSDKEQNRIPDYSYAGYRYGEIELPNVPEVLSISPIAGDNTAHIQKALDAVSTRQPDGNGFRGALVLKPGVYELRSTIQIKASGVVLRGSGDGSDRTKDTILVAKVVDKPIVEGKQDRPSDKSVVILGTNNPAPWKSGDETKITDDFVQVGSLGFNVENASLFKAGDAIIIKHPSTQKWIDALDGGGVGEVDDPDKNPWKPGKINIVYYRRVDRVEGNKIILDAPIYNHLDRKLSQSTVCKIKSSEVLTNVGLENLRIEIDKGGEDEKFLWSAVSVIGAEDAWVRNLTALHFGFSGVYTEGALRVTVTDVKAFDPIAIRTGGRMYNFNTEKHSQLILFQNCEATNGRHNFISNGTSSASGIVFHKCKSKGLGSNSADNSDSEGHRLWTQAMLFDSIDENSLNTGSIALINRGNFGSGHGWSAAHSTIWNYNGTIIVQKPPTAQNYAVSSTGKVQKKFKFSGVIGNVEGEGEKGKLSPASLYEAQLKERLQH